MTASTERKCQLDAIYSFLKIYVDYGMTVEVSKSQYGGIKFDLNTGMKSGLYIVGRGGEFYFETRYKEPELIDECDVGDLEHSIALRIYGCRYGRPYFNTQLIPFLSEHGLVSVDKKQVETIEWS